jgi:hypothetical protein
MNAGVSVSDGNHAALPFAARPRTLSFDLSRPAFEQRDRNAKLLTRTLSILSQNEYAAELLAEGYENKVRFVFDPYKMTKGQGASATTVRYRGWSHFLIIFDPNAREETLALAAIHELRHVHDRDMRYRSSDTLSSAIWGAVFREAMAKVMEGVLAYGPDSTQELRDAYERYTPDAIVTVARAAAAYAQTGDLKTFAGIMLPEYLKQDLPYYQAGVINEFIKWVPRCTGPHNKDFMTDRRFTPAILAKALTIRGERFINESDLPDLRLSSDRRVTEAYAELQRLIDRLSPDDYLSKPIIDMPREVSPSRKMLPLTLSETATAVSDQGMAALLSRASPQAQPAGLNAPV